jgi:phosphohistidine phosphatase
MAMRVYLVRHGAAVAPGVNRERPLSAKGRAEVEALAQLLAKTDIRIKRVYHSGLLRAQQTAEILCPAVVVGPVAMLPGLKPDDPVSDFAAQILTWGEDTMLVGHLPFMEILAGYLITGKERHAVIALETASMACLEYAGDERWLLRWLLSPEVVPVATE